MTKPNLGVMLERYNYNREMERKYREVAERYETEIIKILISQFKENDPSCSEKATEDG